MLRSISKLCLAQFNAFLFDLDGTLIDGSDRQFVESVRTTAEEYGLRDVMIPPGRGLTAFLRQKFPDRDEAFVQEFRARNKQRMLTTPRPVHFHQDALDFIALNNEKPRAIVTNCSDWELEMTERSLDLRALFEVVVYKTADIASKPCGDLYLRGAKFLNIDPQKALVFEDSATGIAAGKDAGMTVVGIDRGTHHDFHEADYVTASFSELL